MGICVKCRKPVDPKNDAARLDIFLGRAGAAGIFLPACHLIPEDGCVGSPSRAQYLEGQPRDPRPRYWYRDDLEAPTRAAFRLMQETTDTQPNVLLAVARAQAELPVSPDSVITPLAKQTSENLSAACQEVKGALS